MLPYPVHLKQATARKLIEYVANGGTLVSEGLPAYFGERGKVGTRQPNYGLDDLFGARESYVEFTPDLLDDLKLEVQGRQIGGSLFLQQYAPAGGTVAGKYEDGTPAATEHRAGKGRTLLIGTFPGASYFRRHSPGTRAFFAGLLTWAGRKQMIEVSNASVKARLHSGAGGDYLWVVNPARQAQTVTVRLDAAAGRYARGRDLWQKGGKVAVAGQTVEAVLEDRNVAVIRLEK